MTLEESTVQSHVTTGLPPCCLRIFRDKFILVGTYELNKATGVRTGSLDVYNVQLNLIKSYPTYGAILDLKLSPFDDNLVITAHSTGNIMIWKIDYDYSVPKLAMIANVQLFDTQVLIASVHFSPLDSKIISVTNTAGESAIVNIEAGGDIEAVTSQVIADSYARIDQKLYEVQGEEINAVDGVVEVFDEPHSLECWTAEFGQLSPFENVLFTGGDDATIIAHDLRSKSKIWSNNRIHGAGVVGIKCSTPNFRSNRPTSIITGSYDDHIRSLDLRMMGDMIYPGSNVPTAKFSELNLGGGVWRFSELPLSLKKNQSTDKNTLMVCCMYDGAKIVTMDENEENNGNEYFQIQHYLKSGHESMCYGGDWCPDFVATCSFYDKSLQLWNPYN
ncbi:diphthine methyltransferase [Monosporozyma unispora]|nr:hypothetical protein C6P44_001467 [Kazachstania unispora]